MQNKSPTKILHITPHLGGGVGRVILGYLTKAKENKNFDHQVACLDYANENATEALKKLGLKLSDNMSKKRESLIKLIGGADIVLMHWWNHPLLYDFLVRNPLPPCRLVMWSHTSGFNAPAVFTKKILTYPDRFVFVTPISLETKEVKSLTNEQKKNLRVILATSGTDYVESVKPKKHQGFNVGYIGTVDYAKIHPNFLKICNRINIPNVKFIVCGGSNEKEMMVEAKKMGTAHKFKFTGLVSDVAKYLSIFDVFGYPLSPKHYGACDQTLIESMTAGVVPVVLNNRMEKCMVRDGKVGIVTKSESEYVKAVERIYKDKKLRDSLSKNGREYAVKNFSIKKTVEDWEETFKKVLIVPKTTKKWNMVKKTASISAVDIFLESLGDYGKDFELYRNTKSTREKRAAEQKIRHLAKSINWQSKTKSTAHQYSSFFPEDPDLYEWSNLMKGDQFL